MKSNEQKGVFQVRSVGKGFIQIKGNSGKLLNLSLYKTVSSTYPEGLKLSTKYYMIYDPKTKILLYAKPENVSNSNSKGFYNESIIAQSCMKAVAHFSHSVEDLKQKTKDMTQWVVETYINKK